jgi:CheY-like chemotaxis protein
MTIRKVLRAIERDLKKHYEERYRVLRAESGGAALDLLRRLQQRNDGVALLLVDHRMPEMNGVELLQEAIKLYPNAKRTLLTAYAERYKKSEALPDRRRRQPYRLQVIHDDDEAENQNGPINVGVARDLNGWRGRHGVGERRGA